MSSILLLSALLLSSGPAGGTTLTTERVANGLSSPLQVVAPRRDVNRLFIVEQRGMIKILDLTTGTVLGTPFLDLSPSGTTITVEQTDSEGGLLSMAFHPDYDQNGFFYVSYTRNSDGASTIRRYTVSGDPNVADPTSGLRIFGALAQPFSNHNGGLIMFGPDKKLYMGLGDGGSGGDPGCRAQDGTTLLGKLLRMNDDGTAVSDNPFVNDSNFLNRIWAYGLRNPWRFSFDRANGDLYIGDVGQDTSEEVNWTPGSSTGGENYGWKMMEGSGCFGTSGCGTVPPCNDPSLVDPIRTYPTGSRCTVVGGFVYRGCAIPDLQGTYFYGDFCSGDIWSMQVSGGNVSNFENRTTELDPPGAQAINAIASFGEDALGELYICDLGGEVFKIVPSGGIVDTNTNNIADSCESSSASRNGALGNPNSFVQVTAPQLGSSWDSTIDIVTPGALGSTIVFAFGGPVSGVSLSGLVNGELLGLPPFASIDTSLSGAHAVPVPLDPGLIGVSAVALGMTFVTGQFDLTNAIDVTLGL